MYRINFEKVKQSSTDFKGKDWFTPREIIKAVYWDISDIPLEHVQYIPKGKYKHYPIVYIDESIRDHMTQIIFILKESFTDTGNIGGRLLSWRGVGRGGLTDGHEFGFTGWKPFSKESLITLCKGEYGIYKDNWPDGNTFVSEFPEKINTFIESYCVEV